MPADSGFFSRGLFVSSKLSHYVSLYDKGVCILAAKVSISNWCSVGARSHTRCMTQDYFIWQFLRCPPCKEFGWPFLVQCMLTVSLTLPAQQKGPWSFFTFMPHLLLPTMVNRPTPLNSCFTANWQQFNCISCYTSKHILWSLFHVHCILQTLLQQDKNCYKISRQGRLIYFKRSIANFFYSFALWKQWRPPVHWPRSLALMPLYLQS